MAKTIRSIFVLLLVVNLLISMAMAGRDIPSNNKPEDIKHPNMFFSHDRGYLIPGLGRGIKPKSKHGFNPFTYNPITGNNNNNGVADIPTFGGVGFPGGDDTLAPNSGFEVPSTGGSGSDSTPVSARP